MSAPNLTAIIANLGNYSQQHGSKLYTYCYEQLEAELSRMGVETIDGIKHQYVMPNMEVTDLIQPGNNEAWTPTDSLKYDSRTMTVERWKVDLQINPEKYIKSYLAHFRKPGVKDTPDTLPFAKYLSEGIMVKASDQLTDSYLHAVKIASPTNHLNFTNGLNEQLRIAVADTKIPVVTLGAITPANVTERLEDMIEMFPYCNEALGATMIVPRVVFNWYVRKHGQDLSVMGLRFNEAAGRDTNQAGVGEVYLRASNVKLVPQTKQKETAAGIFQIILTQNGNLLHGCNMMNDMNNLEMEKFRRLIEVRMDGRMGADFTKAHIDHKPIMVNEAYVTP